MSSIEDNVQTNAQCSTTKELIALISVPIINIDFKAVEDHYKKWKKDKKEEKVDAVKNKKSDAKNKPKKSNKKVDDDGNTKVVQLSKYQIFVKEIQPYINETYPGIAKEERMRKVGDEWKKYKLANAELEEKVIEKKEDEKKPEVKNKVIEKKNDDEITEEDHEITEEKIVEKKEPKKKVKK